MIRKSKKYVRPRKLYEISRIKEENILLIKYALKNKLEVWKTLAKINYFRSRAKDLAKSSDEEQQVLFNKLKSMGLKVDSIADVLDLKIENLLERRLPTILAKKGLALTPQHARQLVVHKKVLVNGNVVNIPSYIVHVEEENKISLKHKVKKPKEAAPVQVEAQPSEEVKQ